MSFGRKNIMKRTPVIVALVISFATYGCATSDPVSQRSYQTTTILGTFAWDVESNRLGDHSHADFWWDQVTDTERYLVPLNGATAAIVKRPQYEKIDADYVRRAALSQGRLAGGDLKPGATIVFRTADGRHGKLRVVGYKALHDFDFPEAAHLSEDWKTFVLGKPNTPQYHLQVRWTLLE